MRATAAIVAESFSATVEYNSPVMSVSDKPKILHTRQFREMFHRCLSKNLVKFQMAAPYITGIPHWHPVTNFCQFLLARGCELEIITNPPGRESSSLSKVHAEIMERQGVNLLIHRNASLHAKVYQFIYATGNRAAFVGSSNFSKGGFERNDEVIAFFSEKCDNDCVARQLERLSGASIEYHYWKVKEATCRKQKNSD